MKVFFLPQMFKTKTQTSNERPFLFSCCGAAGACALFCCLASSRVCLCSSISTRPACTSRTSPCSTSEIYICSCWPPWCASPSPWGRTRSKACGSSSSPTRACFCPPSDTRGLPCPGSLRFGSWRSNPATPPSKRALSGRCCGKRAQWLPCCPRYCPTSRASCPSPIS